MPSVVRIGTEVDFIASISVTVVRSMRETNVVVGMQMPIERMPVIIRRGGDVNMYICRMPRIIWVDYTI